MKTAGQGNKVRIEKLWEAVMSLGEIWPARIQINGVQLGDVWPCADLTDLGNFENLVPFHKLSQWLTYSLIESIESLLDITIEGVELMTGLPEYRNGGLLVDYGLLELKPEQVERGTSQGEELPSFEGSDPLIVEWRALTVVYLDKIKVRVESKLNKKLHLAQVLEGGTWTAGREIAARLRPKDGGPPIIIKVMRICTFCVLCIDFFLSRATELFFKCSIFYNISHFWGLSNDYFQEIYNKIVV